MRNSQIAALTVLVTLSLAACSSGPLPTPSASSLPPSGSPTPTATATTLPTVDAALAALDTGPGDDRSPDIRLGVALEAGQSQFLEDLRPTPFGPGTVRVACANVDGSDVSIEVAIGDATPVTLLAPCAGSTESGTSILTSQDQSFDFVQSYRFTVLSQSDATVAVGVVTNVPQ